MSEDKPWAGKSILIVDDSKTIQVKLASLYSNMGMKVLDIASDGVEALALFEKETPDVVSMDIIMPEMHGIECFNKMRKLNSDFHIVFVSCLAAEAGNSTMLTDKVPVGSFVQKPASADTLERALHAAFGEDKALMLDGVSPSARTVPSAS